ncbi:MAG TPA: response regulator [Chloroflexi bacterium]|nr:response regulator [Chloroflexota bacterium]
MLDKSKQDRYFDILITYIDQPEERLLMSAAQLGRELVLADFQPEDIVEVHEAALRRLAQQNPNMTLRDIGGDASTVLMELLMAYGLAFRERSEARERAEKALRESEALLRRVLDSSPTFVSVKDRDGRYILANETAAQFYNTTPHEMKGLTDLDFAERSQISAISAKQLMAYDRQVVETQQTLFEPEVLISRPDASARWVQVTKMPLERRGWAENCVLTVAVDITERKRAEELMKKQERLTAVGQLASGIALDFNNLLTTIVLYAQTLMTLPNLSLEVSSGLTVILDEAKRAADLVNQILDFSRRSAIEPRPFDLKGAVQKIVDIVRRTLPDHIRLLIEMTEEPLTVNADPTRIQQAVMNLMFNARDAMPERGDLRVELSSVTVGPDDEPPVEGITPGTWACITVSDTGFSIPAPDLPHIFEPFFISTSPGKRTGLELAQVHGIVIQHEGYIDVETSPDGGIAFHVYLPIYEAAADDFLERPEALASLRGKGEIILLVEDEARIQKLGSDLLKSLGYQVLTAPNGIEGLEIHRSAAHIDLVITDLAMPEMGGQDLVHLLKEIDPDLKVIAITGYVSQKGLEQLKAEGFIQVVRKPFDVDTLAIAVRRALEVDNHEE